jgi:predicted small metal-binding protein
MKMLSCRDMGSGDDFVAKGNTEQEVMDKMMEHVKEMHPGKMEGMSEDEKMKMMDMAKMKMKDAM